eukprot:222101_1
MGNAASVPNNDLLHPLSASNRIKFLCAGYIRIQCAEIEQKQNFVLNSMPPEIMEICFNFVGKYVDQCDLWIDSRTEIFFRMRQEKQFIIKGQPANSTILMVGLQGSGKSTILKNICPYNITEKTTSIGWNIERCKYGNMEFIAFDVGGSWHFVESHWRQLFVNDTVKAIVFVVDANDREKVDDYAGFDCSAKEEFHRMRYHCKEDVVWLIFANKMDLQNGMSANEVVERMGLNCLLGLNCHVQQSNAISGKGLAEGLNWLKSNIGYTRRLNGKVVKTRRGSNKSSRNFLDFFQKSASSIL